MKQSLSLRVSQHLALTPQLQQSIRLLQLSTLEMAQEVEQMLDENPFLERSEDGSEREAFGVDGAADAPVSAGEQIADAALVATAGTGDAVADSADAGDADALEARLDGASPVEESWEGDGSVEIAPDDSEWGGDAPARTSGTPSEIVENADVRRVYLGEHFKM